MIKQITLMGKIRLQKEAEKIKNILKDQSGMSVIELLLILVENLALYIEYIEGEKNLKNKLYTRYTQEHGQLKLSKKGK